MTHSNATYRGAIIGLGFIGAADPVSAEALGQRVEDLDGTHVAAMQHNAPRVDLVAGSSRSAGRRERFQQRTGVGVYADWREMLQKERPDIVSVATYAPAHAEISIACAESGVRAIWCEKPIATCLEDAEQMIESCRKNGSLLVVNHNRRFNPNYRRLRDQIQDLGELTSAFVQWGAGRLGNVGTHLFDALCMIVGSPVQAVSATLDLSRRPDCRGAQFHDPGGWGLLRLTSGLTATFDASDWGALPARVEINGIKGRATTGAEDVSLQYWDGRTDHWPSLAAEASSMDRLLQEIVRQLDGQLQFPYDAGDSLHALEIVVACHASHQRNAAWVELPLKGEDRGIEVNSG